MLFNKLFIYGKGFIQKSFTLYGIGRDILDYGRLVVKNRLLHTNQKGRLEKNKSSNEALLAREKDRARIEKNFLIPEKDFHRKTQQEPDYIVKNNMFAKLDTITKNFNSNKSQRNFENHQGN